MEAQAAARNSNNIQVERRKHISEMQLHQAKEQDSARERMVQALSHGGLQLFDCENDGGVMSSQMNEKSVADVLVPSSHKKSKPIATKKRGAAAGSRKKGAKSARRERRKPLFAAE